ncbi:beta-glucosidase [Stakelama sediminis]|uniref:Beta-glucosidase n=2 Tax=Stakelama sediminis TaxID=463200 RepID=A0A840YZ07_9SPHN|nr:glycoside hydrolase family 3 C-terminal domain-containing protein [Stakelama sediminis]MBB5718744.1 beta-glucosidase [Stakelama sediminis]
MTVDEKLGQLLNAAPAIPRLHIPAYNWWTESLHGALGPVPTTNFPEPIGLGATFDTPLVHQVAGAISIEVRGLHTLQREKGKTGNMLGGLDTWSPNINIFRDPRWGRGQETYGEDPFLTAQMGVAFITGMQGPNPDLPHVIATPKHYDVHSGPESTRHVANVFVTPHDLVDTYLPAFRAAIVDAKAGSIMCAYNSINGQPACANDMLLKHYLRGKWHFQGYVVSDCDAVVDISDTHHYAPTGAAGVAIAMRTGVDNECNNRTLSGQPGLTKRYQEALDQGLLSMTDIDRSLVRLFSARYRNGDLPGLANAPVAISPSEIGTKAHWQLALEAAEKSIVLLKNNGILPFKPAMKLAVVGPFGDAIRVLRGNYSSPNAVSPVSVIDGLKQVMDAGKVELVPFGASITDGDPIPESVLRTPDGKPGLKTATELNSDAKTLDKTHTIKTGFLVPKVSGVYRFGMDGTGGTLDFDGKMLVDRRKSHWNDLPTLKTIELKKGHRYPIRIDATGNVGLSWKRISTDPYAALQRAVAHANAIVAVVGLTSDLEGEESDVKAPGFSGGDKTNLKLPADQMKLLEVAKATGKPLIVVLMNGSPINLSWEKQNAAAIVEAWYPGQAGGLAIANVLAGKVDPGGRLPLTFYHSIDDLPPFDDYSMKGRTYRYYEGKPVYPFGYGLSYTHFAYSPLTVTPSPDGAEHGLRVTTEVSNIGGRSGDDVAQLYLNFPDLPGTPKIALRGFQRVHLKPGEKQKVSFELSSRDLSAVATDGTREVMPGSYRITVGSGQPDTGVPVQQATFSIKTSVLLPQ